jgi:hypothetical protein
MKRFFYAVGLVLFALPGCSSTSEPVVAPPLAADPPHDAGVTTDARVPPDIGACHADANTAPVVEVTNVAEERPAFAGGTITDGTYARTSSLVYTGAGGASGPTGERLRQTIRIAGGVARAVYRNEGGPDDRTSFTFSTTGAEVQFAATCPDPASGTTAFTATPTELRMGNASGELLVYTRTGD